MSATFIAALDRPSFFSDNRRVKAAIPERLRFGCTPAISPERTRTPNIKPNKSEEQADVQEHARRRSGDRRLPSARKGALRLRPVRPRQYRLYRRALRAR